MAGFYDFSATLVDGREQPMSDFAGRVLLVVNVASQCGFTPQYESLEALYRRYRDDGLTILAFPCNQFGMQEPGTELEIAAFCQVTYDVTFPLFSKVTVNGRGAHPIYQWLKRQAPGLLGVPRRLGQRTHVLRVVIFPKPQCR